MCNEIVGVNGDEGTPVPIPNTVVKLVYGDNTWLGNKMLQGRLVYERRILI